MAKIKISPFIFLDSVLSVLPTINISEDCESSIYCYNIAEYSLYTHRPDIAGLVTKKIKRTKHNVASTNQCKSLCRNEDLKTQK